MSFREFQAAIKRDHPGVKVRCLNGEDDGPDINGWNGLAVELPNGLRTGVRFQIGHQDEAEAQLLGWIQAHSS